MNRRPDKKSLSATELTKLIEHARCGDKEATARVLEVFRPYLLALARRQLDVELNAKVGASDLVQDTLNEAQQGFSLFGGNDERGVRAWLRTILRNNIADVRERFRANKRQVSLERSFEDAESADLMASLPSANADSPSEVARRRESAERVRETIARLSVRHQLVIRFRYLEGLPFAQIAEQMGITERAARMLHARALDRLAKLHDGKIDRDN